MSALNIGQWMTSMYLYIGIPILGSFLIGYTLCFFKLSRHIRLNKHNHTLTSTHRALQARRPVIIYLYIFNLIILIFVERPMTIYCSNYSHCNQILMSIFSPILFAISVFSMVYMFLLRTWILYYDENFNIAKKDIIWQKNLYLNYLSPSNQFNKCKQDWFLEYKSTVGAPKWFFTRILSIPYSISIIISMYVIYTFHTIPSAANLRFSCL